MTCDQARELTDSELDAAIGPFASRPAERRLSIGDRRAILRIWRKDRRQIDERVS